MSRKNNDDVEQAMPENSRSIPLLSIQQSEAPDTSEPTNAEQNSTQTNSASHHTPPTSISKYDFYQAVRTQDTDRVERLLMQASEEDRKEVCTQPTNAYRVTPLQYAARYHNIKLAEILRSYGADVNVPGNHGRTPLHCAACLFPSSDQQISFVDYLCKNGADVNAQTRFDEQTALHVAVSAGNVQVCKYLLSVSNIDPNLGDFYGNTPLHIAAYSAYHFDLIDLLLNTTRIRKLEKNKAGQTPPDVALDNRNFKFMEIAIYGLGKSTDRNPIYDTKYAKKFYISCERTPLMLAAERSQWDMVKNELETCSCKTTGELCSSVNAKDDTNYTALHYAAQSGNADICKLLVDHGANIEAVNNYKRTSLHVAVRMNRVDVVNYLLDKAGAQLEAYDLMEYTPLHWAVIHGRVPLVKLLLDKNANVFAVDDDGRNVLHWAAKQNHLEVIDMILTLKPNAHDLLITPDDEYGYLPIHCACEAGELDGVHVLLKYNGSTVNKRLWNQKTTLHLAAAAGKTDIVKALLQLKPNLTIETDCAGKTALYYAVTGGHHEAAERLVMADETNVHARRSVLFDDLITMALLVEKMPTLAYATLTRSLKSLHDDAQWIFFHCDYKLLENFVLFGKLRSQPPSSAEKLNWQGLITHPVISSYVMIKWHSYRYYFYFSVALHVLYLLMLVLFMVSWSPINSLPSITQRENASQTVGSWGLEANDTSLLRNLAANVSKSSHEHFCLEIGLIEHGTTNWMLPPRRSLISKYILLATSLLLLFKLVYDWTQSVWPSSDYVISGAAYTFSLIVTIPWTGFSCLDDYALLPTWKWEFASLGLLLVCVHFTMLLRYLPWIGVYVHMFKVVSKTLSRVLILFGLMTLAFALCFHVLFKANEDQCKDTNPFQTMPQALLKTLAMFTGELGLGPFANSNLVMDKIVFIFLVLFGLMALMNLTIGLAVQDTNAIQGLSKIHFASTRANYVMQMVKHGRRSTQAFNTHGIFYDITITKNSGECSVKYWSWEEINLFKSRTYDFLVRHSKCVPSNWLKKIKRTRIETLKFKNNELIQQITEAIDREKRDKARLTADNSLAAARLPGLSKLDLENIKKIVDEAAASSKREQEQSKKDL